MTEKRTFSAADASAFKTRNLATVDVPELGDDVQMKVRGMMAGEYLAVTKFSEDPAMAENAEAIMEVAFLIFRNCVVDDNGASVFADSPEGHEREYPVAVVFRVMEAVFGLSNIELISLPADVQEKVRAAQDETEPDPDAGKGSTRRSGTSASG